MFIAKSTPPSFNSLKSYKVWTEKGYSGSSQTRLPLQVRFLHINGDAGGKKNLGNGRHQTLDAIHILTTAVKIEAYRAVPLESHHSVPKQKRPLWDQFYPSYTSVVHLPDESKLHSRSPVTSASFN